MSSTNVPRTYQSGYSQILGLFPPGSQDVPAAQLSQTEVYNLKNTEKGVPPFKVRDAASINRKLGSKGLP